MGTGPVQCLTGHDDSHTREFCHMGDHSWPYFLFSFFFFYHSLNSSSRFRFDFVLAAWPS